MQVFDTWADVQRTSTGDTPPSAQHIDDGELWWHPATNAMHVFFDNAWHHVGDGAFPAGMSGSMEGTAFVDENQPDILELFTGDLWFNPVQDHLFVYYKGGWHSITLYG